jgi:hypothetical protein
MFLFLLVLGVVITAIGLGVVGSGISVQEHMIDATKVMPGMIAVIGGCILIGLAFVVRALLRVERALKVRQAARPARASSAAADQTEPGRFPFPSKPKAVPLAPLAPAAMAALLASSDAPAAAAQGLPADRIENGPIVEENDVSLLPKAPVRPEDESKASIFGALWKKPQRPTPGAEVPPAQSAALDPAQPAPVDAATPQAAAPVRPPEFAATLSILKSGVVEGIAYTIYSDGSIEARLPDGALRFGSIAELRNHIEQKR